MKLVQKAVRALLLAALSCMLLATAAFAAEPGSVWLNVSEAPDGKGVTALIATDTTVTDGLVELAYDSAKLTFEGVEVNEGYVAMYSVNAEEAGVVRIAWVAPEAYESDGSGIGLISVRFSGEAGDSLALTGSVKAPDGSEVPLTDAPDRTELEKAIVDANAVDGSKYTEESYTALQEALREAAAVYVDPAASQKDIDEATAALRAAIDALVPLPANTPGEGNNPGTTPGDGTTGTGGGSTGDSAMLGAAIGLGVLALAAFAALLVVNKRRHAR